MYLIHIWCLQWYLYFYCFVFCLLPLGVFISCVLCVFSLYVHVCVGSNHYCGVNSWASFLCGNLEHFGIFLVLSYFILILLHTWLGCLIMFDNKYGMLFLYFSCIIIVSIRLYIVHIYIDYTILYSQCVITVLFGVCLALLYFFIATATEKTHILIINIHMYDGSH